MITMKMKILWTVVSICCLINFDCVDNDCEDLMGGEDFDISNTGGDESDNRFD